MAAGGVSTMWLGNAYTSFSLANRGNNHSEDRQRKYKCRLVLLMALCTWLKLSLVLLQRICHTYYPGQENSNSALQVTKLIKHLSYQFIFTLIKIRCSYLSLHF